MKRYVETITVKDWALARSIMLALEKDGRWAVEYRECRNETARGNDYYVEIRVCEEEKLIHDIGFGCSEPVENPVEKLTPTEGDNNEV